MGGLIQPPWLGLGLDKTSYMTYNQIYNDKSYGDILLLDHKPHMLPSWAILGPQYPTAQAGGPACIHCTLVRPVACSVWICIA